MGNLGDYLHMVQSDATTWGEIGALEVNTTKDQASQVAHRVIKTNAHIKETETHIRQLVSSVKENDPESLKTTLTALNELKASLSAAANRGINDLKTAYAERSTEEEKEISQQAAAQQKRIANVVITQIDKHILNLGQKLQTMPTASIAARREQLQATREQSIFSRAFDAVSSLVEEKPLPPPTMASLVDATFGDKWKAVVASGADKKVIIKEALRNQAAHPETIPRQLILGELANRKTAKSKPMQFELDLPRMTDFLVNGRVQFDLERKFAYDPQKARKALSEACEKAVGKEKAALLQDRIECIINQGLFADMEGKIRGVYSSPKLKDNMGGVAKAGMIWSVDIFEGKVSIGLKFSYDLIDSDKHSQDVRPGSVIGKRVYEIPISSLLVSDDEIEKNQLKDVQVTDTYSQKIKSPAFAAAMLLAF